MSKIKTILAIFILLLVTLACNALTPTAAPTQSIDVVSTPTPGKIPLTEAEVPRVSLEKAKDAFDSGAAIIVDVRSKEAYDASHIPGAINIQLSEFETNPTGLNLDKDQWIITYCT